MTKTTNHIKNFEEVTPEMIEAGNAAMNDMQAQNKVGFGGEVVEAVWRAMYKAAKGEDSEFVAAPATSSEGTTGPVPSVDHNEVPKETQTKSKAANAPEVDKTIKKPNVKEA